MPQRYKSFFKEMSTFRTGEEDAIKELEERLHRRFSSHDIRDIYRIIHFLLDILTENEQYNHHYNKEHMIMKCLYRFYASYPESRIAIQSYSVYISERLHEIKRNQYSVERERENRRSSFCRYCTIS